MSKIHPAATVDEGAQLGEDVEVGPYCIVGPQVKLGARTRLQSHVNVEGMTEIGEDCFVHPFASLGGPPQHAAHKGGDTRLVIGDRNLIREYVTMNAGSSVGTGVTQVGSDGMFYTGAHVAHDCVVGDRVLLTNLATLGGHVTIGDYAIVGGLAGVHQFTRIGRYAFVGAMATVVRDVIPYGSVWGNHAHLEGLNLVGLKRRGFSREQINTLRVAYRLLFADEGSFQERVDDVAETYAEAPEVMEVIDFIRADLQAKRPLCMPAREV
jgi:UDP-N-acetylglucosamine acyltransferase